LPLPFGPTTPSPLPGHEDVFQIAHDRSGVAKARRHARQLDDLFAHAPGAVASSSRSVRRSKLAFIRACAASLRRLGLGRAGLGAVTQPVQFAPELIEPPVLFLGEVGLDLGFFSK
jgi:hypothetical protein